ncbi:hypothetical protein LMH87_011877 [Akanthomyces muscarius]|uniref:Uncharacterized protein n=1 Tax=Akanthomyces muscarius TaxID=2231603 RepID=A0A9W8UKD1_AKAMU|nr:hypothetical protein LMH87_011877 [Akanthomyces muscarius]KAJ4151162.1 hypothetical protein LMH87_011877 [Akanthomyces muscarius]
MRTAGRSRIFDVLEPRFDVVVKDKETRGRLKADNAAGYRAVFSYANYLQVDGGVLLSQFGDEETDAAALETVRKAFLREKFDGCVHDGLAMQRPLRPALLQDCEFAAK